MSLSIPYKTGVSGAPRLTDVVDADMRVMVSAFQYPIKSLGPDSYLEVQTDANSTTAPTRLVVGTVIQWSFTIAEINTALTLAITIYADCYYDSVDLATYLLYQEGSSPVQLLKVTNAGTLTRIGSDSVSNYTSMGSSSTSNLYRTTSGSGNLLYRTSSGIVAGEDTISISDGTVASSAGLSLANSTTTLTLTAKYITADKSAAIGVTSFTAEGASQDVERLVEIKRKNSSMYVSQRELNFGAYGLSNTANWKLKEWDDHIILVAFPAASVISMTFRGARIWTRPVFDNWINDVCDYYGIGL